MKKILPLAVSVFAACLPAAAQDRQLSACPNDQWLTGQASDFVEVFDAARNSSMTRGEFETTTAFEARKATTSKPKPALIKIQSKPEWFKYDADIQAFKLHTYVLESVPVYTHNMMGERKKFYSTAGGQSIAIKAGEAEISRSEFVGSNAYGAETVAERVKDEEYVIFEGVGRKRDNHDNLFFELDRFPGELPYVLLPIPLEYAPAFKKNVEVVAYVEPFAPYSDTASYFRAATRQFPVEGNTEYKILLADIKCVGFRSPTGEVVISLSTR